MIYHKMPKRRNNAKSQEHKQLGRLKMLYICSNSEENQIYKYECILLIFCGWKCGLIWKEKVLVFEGDNEFFSGGGKK